MYHFCPQTATLWTRSIEGQKRHKTHTIAFDLTYVLRERLMLAIPMAMLPIHYHEIMMSTLKGWINSRPVDTWLNVYRD
jgi:hypothetical protein